MNLYGSSSIRIDSLDPSLIAQLIIIHSLDYYYELTFALLIDRLNSYM